MNLKGTQSETNVKAALAGESLARNKYTFYAQQAAAEGKTEIAEFFEKMSKNETAHAKIWFNILNGRSSSTEDNLEEAAQGENYEWMNMYPGFAEIARLEGLEELAVMFEKVGEIERDHERQFLKTLLKEKVSEAHAPKEEAVQIHGHRCQFCGAKFEKRPDVCSVCQAIGAFESCTMD